MRIHQFTVKYLPEEDRLLLRLNTVDRQELRFLLTRRFVRLLWPVLNRILQQDREQRHPTAPGAAAEIAAFEQEKAISRADFEKKFEEAPAGFPLGEAPVLFTRIQVGRKRVGEVLSLLPRTGPGIELPAHPGILHNFRRLISDAVAIAQWDLDVSMHPEASPGSRSIH